MSDNKTINPVVTQQTLDVEVPKEMSLIEKVKLMNDLATAADDENIKSALLKHSNGKRILQLFVDAIEKELSATMNGRKEVVKEVDNLVGAVKQAGSVLGNYRDLMVLFMNGPLVQVLNLMNNQLGQRNFEFNDNSQLNPPVNNQPRQPEYNDNNGGGRSTGRSSVTGLGSF